jgi:hypothetical protein
MSIIFMSDPHYLGASKGDGYFTRFTSRSVVLVLASYFFGSFANACYQLTQANSGVASVCLSLASVPLLLVAVRAASACIYEILSLDGVAVLAASTCIPAFTVSRSLLSRAVFFYIHGVALLAAGGCISALKASVLAFSAQ